MTRILSVGLLCAVSAASTFASVDSGLIALIPGDSKLIAGFDVTKCRNSEFGQYLLSKSQSDDAHFEQFMTQTGFDPRRDLDSLIMASSSANGERNSPFVIMARGSFDQAKISSLAASKGGIAQTYKGVNLLVSTDHKQTVALAFPDTGVAVMGDLNSVQQVVQNLTTSSALDVDVTNRIAAVGAANDAWFVSAVGGAGLGRQLSAQLGSEVSSQGQALQSIRAADGGVKFGSVVAISLDASTRSAQDASSLSDVFRFMTSMIQMSGTKDPRASIISATLQNMQLKTDGDTVHVEFSMTEKNLEQIADSDTQRKQ